MTMDWAISLKRKGYIVDLLPFRKKDMTKTYTFIYIICEVER